MYYDTLIPRTKLPWVYTIAKRKNLILLGIDIR